MEKRSFVTYLKPRVNTLQINSHSRGWLELPDGRQRNPTLSHHFTDMICRRSGLNYLITWLRGVRHGK